MTPHANPVTVNGEPIPPARIAAEMQHHPVPPGKPGLAWQLAARALAIRALLRQEAHRRGLAPPTTDHPADDPGAPPRETGEEALVQALVEAELGDAAPDEAALHAAWARDPARFRSAPLWEASHILCACDPADAGAAAAALARARALSARLAAAPDGFARLARAESDCASRAAGGALGQLGPGDSLPEFEAALSRLAEGGITAEPVRTRHGWHLIRLDARAEGRVLPYETVRPRLAEAMEKAMWAQAACRLVARLVAAAEIRGLDLTAPAPPPSRPRPPDQDRGVAARGNPNDAGHRAGQRREDSRHGHRLHRTVDPPAGG